MFPRSKTVGSTRSGTQKRSTNRKVAPPYPNKATLSFPFRVSRPSLTCMLGYYGTTYGYGIPRCCIIVLVTHAWTTIACETTRGTYDTLGRVDTRWVVITVDVGIAVQYTGGTFSLHFPSLGWSIGVTRG